MQTNNLPASVKDVAGPMAEAAGYERLRVERQRGVYNLALGGLIVVFVATQGLDEGWPDWAILTEVFAMGAGMFAFLRWMKRNRPWPGVFQPVDLRPLKEDPLRMAMIGAVVAFFLLRTIGEEALAGTAARLVSAAAVLVFCAGLSFAARWRGDRATQIAYWITALGAVPIALGLVPAALTFTVTNLAFAAPLIALGSWRAFAPRRWLVA